MSQQKTVSETLSALRLIRSEGVGPTTFTRLAERFEGIGAALNAMPHMRKPIIPPDPKLIEKEYHALLKMGGQWLCKHDADYPELLAPLEDAPPVISILGKAELLQRPMIAIVGARNASIAGRKLAMQIAGELGQAGYVIVSGLARGIDTVVHEASLETGTVAVLANGADVVYPPENQKLYSVICEKGVILSENPLGSQPTAMLFPRRNRIISGLCQGVIVIEAAHKSGSLITTKFALDQGREVFAVPGSPLDPRAQGPNHLIKTGQAHLIESARDVLNVMKGLRNFDSPQMNFALDQVEAMPTDDIHFDVADVLPVGASLTDDQARATVLGHLSPTPCDIDQLGFTTQLETSRLLAILMELELTGQVQRVSGSQVVRI